MRKWTGTVSVQLDTYFWIFCVFLVAAFLAWYWGWGPRLGSEARSRIEENLGYSKGFS